jgi:hypothetical protein
MEEARVFAGDEPCHREERRHASSRFDALQTAKCLSKINFILIAKSLDDPFNILNQG